jgi:hypothetical protein
VRLGRLCISLGLEGLVVVVDLGKVEMVAKIQT